MMTMTRLQSPMSRIAAAVFVALAGTLALACVGADVGPGAGVVVKDSAGVTLVRIGDLASLAVPAREITTAVEVGAQAGTELFRVSAVRLLGSGTLAIGNAGTGEVLYVDGAGEVVRRVGGEGEGPGEFRDITSFPGVRGDTLTVYDVRLGRLTVLDPAGAVLSTRPLEPPSRVVDLLPLAVGDNGRVLAVYGEARIFGRGGIARDTSPLLVIRPPSRVDTVGLWPAKEWSYASMGQGSIRTEVGFGRALYASGRSGRAVLGSTDTLAIVVVDLDGQTRVRIEGTAPNRSVPPEQVERWRAERLAQLPEEVPAAVRTAIGNAPHRETFPAFSDLLLDADGRVWIAETPDFAATERHWIVLDPGGSSPGGSSGFRVTLPALATPMDAAGDRLVVLDRTELDEEVVRVLSLGAPS